MVKTTEGEFETQSLILATGSKRAAPKIRGVKEFEGKGVSYCAICDAFFYRGKDVAVLGNGDFAMHEAKELSNTASTNQPAADRPDRREPEMGDGYVKPYESDGHLDGTELLIGLEAA